MTKVSYKVGDKVFAKVKGYPPWPARVEGEAGKKYNVVFYGTQETGAIKPEDLCYYLKNKEGIVHKYIKKRGGYEDAVNQIEEAIKNDGGDGNDGNESVQEIDMSDSSSVSGTSASEKKAPKRKANSLPDEPVPKKTYGRPRRKSVAVDPKEDNDTNASEKKLPRRKSNVSTGSKDEADETKSEDNLKQEDSPKKQVDKKNESEKHVDEENKPEKQVDEENKGQEKQVDEVPKPETETENTDTEPIKKKAKVTRKDSSETWTESEIEAVQDAGTNNQSNNSITEHELEFIEVKPCEDLSAEGGSDTDSADTKYEIVTEQALKNNILYAEHIKKNAQKFKERPVEDRIDSRAQVLAVTLPSGTICGIRIHKQWPLENFTNEHDRALYDETMAKSILQIKEGLTSGSKTINDEVDFEIIPNIHMTVDDVKEQSYSLSIETKRKRLERLKKEAALVSWDSKIKQSLCMDKAMPDEALSSLKEFSKHERHVDLLVLLKHPHIMDTIRRLRKYVGNVKEWEMTDDDIEVFSRKAEKIRNEAEKIYNKIKDIVKLSTDNLTFWDAFMKAVADFRNNAKDFTENEILLLCSKPDTRQGFLEKLEVALDSEVKETTPKSSGPALKDTSVEAEKKGTAPV